jgi:biotin transport system substrate-specific component
MTTATTSARIGGDRRVLADLVPGADTLARSAALVVGGAVLTGLAAQFAVNVPGSPVPVTGQTFAVLLTGAALGSKRGAVSMALYAAAGMAGVPWFTQGSSGSVHMATLGYIVGFVFAAALTGRLVERRGVDRSPVRTVLVMAAAMVVTYAFGVTWLAHSLHQSLGWGVDKGLTPFLIGDGIKIALAAGLLPSAWRLARKGDRA